MAEFKAPGSEAFRRALERLGRDLPRGYLKLLQSHYAAPEHTITATELARSIGYKNHSAANLHYGKLAALLKSELKWSTGESVGLKWLVEFVDPGERNNAEILWVMRPQLAEALEELRWVKAP
ncbi:hypothetical protein BH24GEM1_BH24GEM1_00790 [soil metagenome]